MLLNRMLCIQCFYWLQVGKTGAWHLLVKMLHDHLNSSKGVVIETGSPANSMFLKGQQPGSTRHSKIVTMDYLLSASCNGLEPSTPALNTPPLVSAVNTVSISTSQYMAYDASHSCTDCLHLRQTQHSDTVLSHLPTAGGSPVVLKWHIPASQTDHCVLTTDNGRSFLQRLRQSRGREGIRTPVFIPTTGRHSTGLFNLSHTDYQQLQVLVTTDNEFNKYCKSWPNMIIMALPDHHPPGLGLLSETSLLYYTRILVGIASNSFISLFVEYRMCIIIIFVR